VLNQTAATGGAADDDCYLALLHDCAAAVANNTADLADGHLILQRLRNEGRGPSLPIFNALLRVCAEAARAGRAVTADGERVVEQMLDEGLRPDAATHVAMLDVIAHAAAQTPPAGFLSEGYRWLLSMRRNGMRLTKEALDAYMRIYDNQWPWCAEP
jgi:hypothetical protein